MTDEKFLFIQDVRDKKRQPGAATTAGRTPANLAGLNYRLTTLRKRSVKK